jgi:hypothetical protein
LLNNGLSLPRSFVVSKAGTVGGLVLIKAKILSLVASTIAALGWHQPGEDGHSLARGKILPDLILIVLAAGDRIGCWMSKRIQSNTTDRRSRFKNAGPNRLGTHNL